MNATPRPWRKDGEQVSPLRTGAGIEATVYLVGGDDSENPTIFVSSHCATKQEREQFHANAALIVRAVNAHDDLLAACERVALYKDELFALGYAPLAQKCIEAIAKAKGTT